MALRAVDFHRIASNIKMAVRQATAMIRSNDPAIGYNRRPHN